MIKRLLPVRLPLLSSFRGGGASLAFAEDDETPVVTEQPTDTGSAGDDTTGGSTEETTTDDTTTDDTATDDTTTDGAEDGAEGGDATADDTAEGDTTPAEEGSNTSEESEEAAEAPAEVVVLEGALKLVKKTDEAGKPFWEMQLTPATDQYVSVIPVNSASIDAYSGASKTARVQAGEYYSVFAGLGSGELGFYLTADDATPLVFGNSEYSAQVEGHFRKATDGQYYAFNGGRQIVGGPYSSLEAAVAGLRAIENNPEGTIIFGPTFKLIPNKEGDKIVGYKAVISSWSKFGSVSLHHKGKSILEVSGIDSKSIDITSGLYFEISGGSGVDIYIDPNTFEVTSFIGGINKDGFDLFTARDGRVFVFDANENLITIGTSREDALAKAKAALAGGAGGAAGGELAKTGGEGVVGMALAAGLLIAAGAGSLALRRRNS